MPTFRTVQKLPGDWVILFDDSDLDRMQKDVFSSMAEHIANCIGYTCAVHNISLDDSLRMAGIAREIQDKYLNDRLPVATEDDYLDTLIYPLELAYLFSIYTLGAVADDLPAAIKSYSASVSSLARFKTSLVWLESGSSPDTGSKKMLIDPSEIGKAGAKVRWGPRDAVREFALQKFNEREWQSRADGIRRIAKDVFKKADEVGFPYKTSNFERTISDWIRASNTSGS